MDGYQTSWNISLTFRTFSKFYWIKEWNCRTEQFFIRKSDRSGSFQELWGTYSSCIYKSYLSCIFIFPFYQAKDERIAQLETENAMLYLKLAQLHGTLQSSREENTDLNTQYEDEKKFRKAVAETAVKLRAEINVRKFGISLCMMCCWNCGQVNESGNKCEKIWYTYHYVRCVADIAVRLRAEINTRKFSMLIIMCDVLLKLPSGWERK